MTDDPASIHSAAIHCVQCGYDLSGSAVGGVCPECGIQVQRSIRVATTSAQSTGSAITCMVLGILSLVVCAILGPFAIVTYHTYQREVEQGQASSAGQTMAKAGLTCGWIATVVLVLQLGLVGLVVVAG